MKMIKKILYPTLFLAALLLGGSSAAAVHAASGPVLFFRELPSDTGVLGLGVYISSQLPLNAYKLTVHYPNQLLQLKKIDLEETLLQIIQTDAASQLDGLIALAGGSISPFSGQKGLLAKLYFKPIDSGAGNMSFLQASLYQADGKGTKIEDPSFSAYALNISPKFVSQAASPPITDSSSSSINGDIKPPKIEFFSVVAVSINPDQNLLVFEVKDSGSGIKLIQVQTRSGLFWSAATNARNPYPLPKNVWSVKLLTFDATGNYEEKIIYIKDVLIKDLAYILGLASLITLGIWIVIRRKRK